MVPFNKQKCCLRASSNLGGYRSKRLSFSQCSDRIEAKCVSFPCSLLLVVSLGKKGNLLCNSLMLILFKSNSNTGKTEF